MKINEKYLCAYATSPEYAPDKEGYLMKKGDINKGYQKRWFVLKGNLLFYFDKRTDKEPLGMIILEGCNIELDENDAQFSFKIDFNGPGNRVYVLCADSQESMEQWMTSLTRASYDYMKIMVTDLQRQLKETQKCVMSVDSAGGENPQTRSINYNNSLQDNSARNSPQVPPRNRSRTQTPSTPSRSKNGLSGTNSSSTFHSQRKITFRTWHTELGKLILRDRNMWRYTKNKKSMEETQTKVINETTNNQLANNSTNLISFL